MTNTVPNLSAVSSDESFTPLTDTALAVAEPTSVGEDAPIVEGGIAGLEARTLLVRDQFDANMVDETSAYNSAEDSQANLLAMGNENAHEWLANKPLLYKRLAGIGVSTSGLSDIDLLGQIAKLQLGRWVGDKFVLPARRHERLGRFYRIFYGDPVKFPRATLRDVILKYPKRSGGILADASPKKVTISKKEKNENLKLAKKAEPVAKLAVPSVDFGKSGQFRLALVRVTGSGLDICTIIDGEDALTTRLTDKWAAETALTVASDTE